MLLWHPDIPFVRAESLLFGLEPTRLRVSRLIEPLEHFGWGAASEGAPGQTPKESL